MKNNLVKLSVAILVLGFSLSAVARIGTSAKSVSGALKVLNGGIHGGGGSRLESAFRLTATSIIESVAKNASANDLCPSSNLTTGLNSSKIMVVDRLTNLNTGKSIDENQLDAWTRPGNIQLRQAAWMTYLTEDDRLPPSVYALVLHELYRTTSCDDDTGTLSTAVVKMMSTAPEDQAKKLKKLYAMKYIVPNPTGVSSFKKTYVMHNTLCESSINILTAPAGVRCIINGVTLQDDGTYRGNTFLVRTTGSPSSPLTIEKQVLDDSIFEFIRTNSVYITPDLPLYVIFDMRFGEYFYGTSLSNMRYFN
jgi:hypothetical protein